MLYYIFFFSIIAFGCSQGQTTTAGIPQKNMASDSLMPHEYEEMPLIIFLEDMFSNHSSTIKSIDNQSFVAFCNKNQLSASDSLNRSRYARIHFFHDLFTASGAYDCNTGGILQIPYFWHWTTPNPRHEIEYLLSESPQKLNEIKPAYGFQRYKSMADIDRTPGLYLSDLFTDSPKYRHPDCGEFYTFGWCSEREMAFAMLLHFMEMESKVVVNVNHSWTETLVKMTKSDGGQKWMVAKTDNTFDQVSWSPFDGKPETWRIALGSTKTDRWYNEMVRSKAEQNLVKAIRVIPAVSKLVDDAVTAFYARKRN